MKKGWQLQEAKNHLSELIDRTLNEGVQTMIGGNPPDRVEMRDEIQRSSAR